MVQFARKIVTIVKYYNIHTPNNIASKYKAKIAITSRRNKFIIVGDFNICLSSNDRTDKRML